MGAPTLPTAAEAGELIRRQLPPSMIGLFRRGWAALDALLSASGAEFARTDQRALDAIEEFFPNTADETIATWEALLNLTPSPAATLAERQAACGAKFRARGGADPAYLHAVVCAFGYAPGDVTIDEPASGFTAFRTGVGRMGDHIGGSGTHAHSFLVTYPLPSNPTMEALITEIKPAHTWAYFAAV